MADAASAISAAVQELVARGAEAVVLAGSHARREATELSDVDLYAIGSGPRYTLRAVGGVLVSISWRTPDEERRALTDPARVGGAVPGWRSVEILHDTGVASALQAQARAFDWTTISDRCDAWVASEITGYAEEVLKLVAARRAGDVLLAAVQRSVLALRLPRVLSVRHRLLYDSENRLWALVAEAMGDEWAEVQETALGVRRHGDPDAAAVRLYRMAAEDARGLVSPDQRAVVDLALSAADELVGAAPSQEHDARSVNG